MGVIFHATKEAWIKESKMSQNIKGVWEFTSSTSGPTVAIVGGTHGNELTGIAVVSELKKLFDSGKFTLQKGHLYLIKGNPAAILIGERGSVEWGDLNRCFTKDILGGEGEGYECQRARELAPIIASVDVGIDLHATNKPSMPFIFCQPVPGELHKQLFALAGVQNVLTDPEWVFAGQQVTLDEHMASGGGVGLCWETGHAEDTSSVEDVCQRILHMLAHLGLIEMDIPEALNNPEIYTLEQVVILQSLDFVFVYSCQVSNFESVSQGELIGADGENNYYAESDGVIIFPKILKLRKVGKPVCYLASRN